MKQFLLKDRREADIDIWNMNDLELFIAGSNHITDDKHHPKFRGFAFFGPDTLEELDCQHENNIYEDETELSPLELQSRLDLPKMDHHRLIVAKTGEEVSGTAFCRWEKYSPKGFWRYHVDYIEVHNNFRNQGIATNMIKAIDKAEFIKGKILEIGGYTPDGEKFIESLINKELKAKDYALIFEDYEEEAPTTFGIY